jgi:hypothetical protein
VTVAGTVCDAVGERVGRVGTKPNTTVERGVGNSLGHLVMGGEADKVLVLTRQHLIAKFLLLGQIDASFSSDCRACRVKDMLRGDVALSQLYVAFSMERYKRKGSCCY